MNYNCFTKVLKEGFDGNLPTYGNLKFKFNPSSSNNNSNVLYNETGVVKSTTPFTFNGNTYTELTVDGSGERQLYFTSNEETELTLEKYKVSTLYFNTGLQLIDFNTEILRNSAINKLFVSGNSENGSYFNLEDFKDFVNIRYNDTNATMKVLDIANLGGMNPNIIELVILNGTGLFGRFEDYLEGILRVRTTSEKLYFDVHNSGILFNGSAIHWNMKIIFTSTTITVKNGEETTTYGTYTQGSGWSYS